MLWVAARGRSRGSWRRNGDFLEVGKGGGERCVGNWRDRPTGRGSGAAQGAAAARLGGAVRRCIGQVRVAGSRPGGAGQERCAGGWRGGGWVLRVCLGGGVGRKYDRYEYVMSAWAAGTGLFGLLELLLQPFFCHLKLHLIAVCLCWLELDCRNLVKLER